MREQGKLLGQQRVGTLQFKMPHEQALYAFRHLVKLCLLGMFLHGRRHCRGQARFCREIASLALRIGAVGARSVVHMLQFNGKQGGKVAFS